MRALGLLLLVAGCAAQPQQHVGHSCVHQGTCDGFAWQGKVGEGARMFGSGLAAHEVFLNDAEGCDWLVLRQPAEQREPVFLQCMALRGWLPVKVPR